MRAGRAAEARLRIAGEKFRRFERFAGLERIGEIESVEAAGDAHLPIGRLLHGDAPVAAPGQRAEPDAAGFLGGVAGVDGEPRVEIVAGVALAALQHLFAFVDRLVVDLHFGRPAAAQVRELVAIAGRQVPGGGLRALHRERIGRAVANGGGAADDAVIRIDAVVEGDLDGIADVLQDDVEIVVVDALRGVLQNQVAVAIRPWRF